MKKLLILCLMLLFGVVAKGSTVNADSDNFIWSCFNAYSNYYWVQGVLPGPIENAEEVTEVIIRIPNNATSRQVLEGDYGGLNLNVRLYSDTSVIGELWNYSHGQETVSATGHMDGVYSTFVINYDAYDLDSSLLDGLVFNIPANSCQSSNTGLYIANELNAGASIEYVREPLALGDIRLKLDFNVDESNGDSSTHDRLTTQYIYVPSDIGSLQVRLGAGYDYPRQSYVEFYNADKALLDRLDIVKNNDYGWEWFPGDSDFLIDVPIDLVANTEYIKVITFYDNANYLLYRAMSMQGYFSYTYDADWIDVYYIADGEVIYDTISRTNAFAPFKESITIPTPDGLVFSHWIDSNGNRWDDSYNITASQINNGVANFYAVFVDEEDLINIVIGDETSGGFLDGLFNGLGINDVIERVIVFVVILAIVTVFLVVKQVPIFNILIVDGIILAFFMSLGLLPSFVTITIIVILVFFGYRRMKAGV